MNKGETKEIVAACAVGLVLYPSLYVFKGLAYVYMPIAFATDVAACVVSGTFNGVCSAIDRTFGSKQ